MATLFISYFGTVDKGVAGDPVASETVTTSTTSAQSAAVPKFALVAKIVSDTAHYIAQGANPTATATNGAYLSANDPLWLRCTNGYKFAAITLA